MSDPVFVVQTNVPAFNAEALERSIVDAGMSCRFFRYLPNTECPHDLAGVESIAHSAHVVCFASVTVMDRIQKTRSWSPMGWCNFDNFCCSAYYPRFGKFMTNERHVLLPASEVYRQRNFLTEKIGGGDSVFVRPDRADKSFTGCLADIDELERLFRSKPYDRTELMLVSSPKNIFKEWRLFVSNSVVVSGCQYRDGDIAIVDSLPEDVVDFAEQLLQRVSWRPAPLIVLDIAETSNGLSVMELNPFGSAGHLVCDTDKIVASALEQARRSW